MSNFIKADQYYLNRHKAIQCAFAAGDAYEVQQESLAPVLATLGEKNSLFEDDQPDVVQETRMLRNRRILRYPDDRIDHGKEALRIFASTQKERLLSGIGRIVEFIGWLFGFTVERFQKYHYRSHNESDEEIYKYDSPMVITDNPEPTSYWLGHATLLLNLPLTAEDGAVETFNVLTDPVEGDLNPFLYRRKTQFAMPMEDLPATHVYLLSHNHVDHFDKGSITKLVDEQPMMVVPMGDGELYTAMGFRDVVELNWWEAQTINLVKNGHQFAMTICATPANHWAGQGPCSGHESTFLGYVIGGCEGGDIYFAGDTARLNDDHIAKLRDHFDIRWCFQPGGPDEVRADMQSTHQASVDALWMHVKLMMTKVYDKDMSKAQFMEKVGKLKTIYMHTMTFKLGNLHLSDTKDSVARVLEALSYDEYTMERPDFGLREYEQAVIDEIREMIEKWVFANDEYLFPSDVAQIFRQTVAIPKIGSRISLSAPLRDKDLFSNFTSM